MCIRDSLYTDLRAVLVRHAQVVALAERDAAGGQLLLLRLLGLALPLPPDLLHGTGLFQWPTDPPHAHAQGKALLVDREHRDQPGLSGRLQILQFLRGELRGTRGSLRP